VTIRYLLPVNSNIDRGGHDRTSCVCDTVVAGGGVIIYLRLMCEKKRGVEHLSESLLLFITVWF